MPYNTTNARSSASQGHSSPDPQTRKNRRASSDRLPQGISFKLVSLVSKFEALDALSLPPTTTALNSAPLQAARKPSTQKGHSRSNYRSRLSTIFSPRRGSPEKNDHDLLEDQVQAAQADFFGLSKPGRTTSVDESQDVRRLRKTQTSYNSSSTRSRGGVWGAIDVDYGTGIGSIAAPYIQNEAPDEKRRESIRDRIKFYDGAVSTGDRTRANSSTINTATPSTPVSVPRSRLLDKRYFPTSSTGSSKRTCAQISDADAVTPTRPHRISNARTLKFGRPTQNQSVVQSSLTWSSHSNVTSQTVRRARPYRNGQDTSPSRVSIERKRIPGLIREGPNAKVETKAYPASGIGGDGSVPPPLVGEDESDQLLNRRRLSSKIEELYRKKSMEKKREDAQGLKKQQEATSLIAKANRAPVLETKATESRPGKLAEITRTKVAAMRKLFDGKFSPRSTTPEPCCGLDPILDTVVPPPLSPSPQHDQTPVKSTPTPPMRQVYSTPSPKTLPTEMEVKSWEIEQTPGVSELANVFETPTTRPSQSASPVKKLSPAKSKFIEEKVKKFESVSESAQPSRGKVFRRRLSKSLRSLFEVSLRKSQEEDPEKNKPPVALLNTRKMEIIDEGGMANKRGTIIERWNKMPTAVSSQGDGTASERESVSPCPCEEFEKRETVVKSVECGLREPRPVRAVEMKRMALLCKDRVGGIMDRDKGRVSQRRKL